MLYKTNCLHLFKHLFDVENFLNLSFNKFQEQQRGERECYGEGVGRRAK